MLLGDNPAAFLLQKICTVTGFLFLSNINVPQFTSICKD